MKIHLPLLFACGLALSAANAQNVPPTVPPAPPSQPIAPPPAPEAPPRPPRPGSRDDSGVYLGVEAGRVPSALSDQLNLPAGFGLLVDYVSPGSAAEAAGVKKHDILKQLNDQILTSEEQLSVLVRSFAEGQEVTLVVLRKGKETKLTAKLQKRQGHGDRPGRRGPGEHADNFDFHFDFDDGNMGPDISEMVRDSLELAREKAEEAGVRANEQVKRALDAVREREARTSGSRIDVDDAHIVLSDSTGQLQIRSSHGKHTLSVRDGEGKKVFEGQIDTPEQRKAIPADILPRVEALEHEQNTTFPTPGDNDRGA